jgi:hypothetical protein
MRLYIVGIRSDIMRTRHQGVPFFPEPPSLPAPSMRTTITPLPHGENWKPHPELDATSKSLAYKNVMSAYGQCAPTVNPFRVPVVCDTGCSERYASFRVDGSPTITKTRGSQKSGYWCSTKGGFLTPTDLAGLQGFRQEEFPWIEVGLSHAQAGALLGNAQTLPLVADILCHAMFYAQLVNLEEFRSMKSQFQLTD